MIKRIILVGSIAVILFAASANTPEPLISASDNFWVQVVNPDFSGLAGMKVDVLNGGSLLASGVTDANGNVLFSLPVGGLYEFKAGDASTFASVSTLPSAVMAGVVLMPTTAPIVEYQVQVVRPDFSGYAGIQVEVLDGSSLLASGTSGSGGFVIFNLPVGGPYLFKASTASTLAAVPANPAPTMVGIIIMLGSNTPAVTTVKSDSITLNSARLYGQLNSLGSAASCNLSFQYGITPTVYTNESAINTVKTPNAFTIDISGLSAGVTYYFRAKSAGDGVAYGDEMSFTTDITPPAVTTDTAGNITTNSARLNGNLISRGTADSCSVLFQWRLASIADYTDNTSTQIKTGTGTFYADISGLIPSTSYCYRAVATGHGTAIGSEMSFITGTIPPTVLTDNATSVTYNSVTLSGTLSDVGTSAADNVSFEWGQSQGGPFNNTIAKIMITQGSFTDNLTGLDENTMYYYRALAVGDGTASGSLISFTTANRPAPPQAAVSSTNTGGVPIFSATVLGQTSMRATNAAGALTSPMIASSKDGNLTIELARGTKILRNGMRILSIEANQTESPPAADGLDVIVAYEFSPSGTVFDPAPRVTVKYDADKLPGNTMGVALARYDGNNWEELPSEGVAEIGGPVNGRVDHFSKIGVVAKLAPLSEKTITASPNGLHPNFVADKFMINPSVINAGEVARVRISIANDGNKEGTYTLILKMDGKQIASREVTLAPGQEVASSFAIRDAAPGKHIIEMAGQNGSFILDDGFNGLRNLWAQLLQSLSLR